MLDLADAWAEADFESIAEVAIAMEFDAAAEIVAAWRRRGRRRRRRRICRKGIQPETKLAGKSDEARLLAPGSGKQGAHGNEWLRRRYLRICVALWRSALGTEIRAVKPDALILRRLRLISLVARCSG